MNCIEIITSIDTALGPITGFLNNVIGANTVKSMLPTTNP